MEKATANPWSDFLKHYHKNITPSQSFKKNEEDCWYKEKMPNYHKVTSLSYLVKYFNQYLQFLISSNDSMMHHHFAPFITNTFINQLSNKTDPPTTLKNLIEKIIIDLTPAAQLCEKNFGLAYALCKFKIPEKCHLYLEILTHINTQQSHSCQFTKGKIPFLLLLNCLSNYLIRYHPKSLNKVGAYHRCLNIKTKTYDFFCARDLEQHQTATALKRSIHLPEQKTAKSANLIAKTLTQQSITTTDSLGLAPLEKPCIHLAQPLPNGIHKSHNNAVGYNTNHCLLSSGVFMLLLTSSLAILNSNHQQSTQPHLLFKRVMSSLQLITMSLFVICIARQLHKKLPSIISPIPQKKTLTPTTKSDNLTQIPHSSHHCIMNCIRLGYCFGFGYCVFSISGTVLVTLQRGTGRSHQCEESSYKECDSPVLCFIFSDR